MALPIGEVIGLLSDNLRLRGSVFPIPTRRVTGWSRGLDLPTGGSTVLYTGQMYQLIPYIETAVRLMERVGDTPIAPLTGLGRRVNRIVNLTGLAIHPSASTMAPYNEILRNVAVLLKQAGVEFGYLYADDHYSGALAHDLGLDAVVARHARIVTAMFRRHGVTDVITVDPHTTHMLRSVFPKLVDGYDLRVRGYLEVLAERLPTPCSPVDPVGEANNAPETEPLTIHDSCLFARYEGVIDQPRALLASAGIPVREPANAAGMTWCCGGPAESLYPAKARATAARRVSQLRETAGHGGTAVTMCPLCLVNLRKAAGDTLRLRDISHDLRRAYAPQATKTRTD